KVFSMNQAQGGLARNRFGHFEADVLQKFSEKFSTRFFIVHHQEFSPGALVTADPAVPSLRLRDRDLMHGQIEPECAPGSDGTLDMQLAAQKTDNSFADIETQSDSLRGSIVVGRLEKRFEQVWQIFFRDRFSRVLHFEPDLIVDSLDAH